MMGVIAHEQAQQLRLAMDKMFHELSDSSDIPKSARNAFSRLVDMLESHADVIVFPSETFMTTQQAAELLGVSRMTVVRLIDRGDLVSEAGGVHRRISAAELARYRADSAARRRAALHELSQEIDRNTPPDQVIRTR